MTTATLSINAGSAINSVSAEPSILSANTYFWNPAGNAGCRRRNEERNQSIVAGYFTELGFHVERNGDVVSGTRQFEGKEIRVVFSYSESCANVYKSLTVTKDGRNSNVTAIRKIAKSL